MIELPFWTWQFIGTLLLNAVIQIAAVGAFAARVAGVTTHRIALSISLFSLVAFASRLANLFYAPMLATIADRTGDVVAKTLGSPALAAAPLGQFDLQVRLIVFAGTIGTLIGALFLPVFEYLFVRGINSYQRTDSVPRSLLRLLNAGVLLDVVRAFRLPRPALWSLHHPSRVPGKLLFWNTVLQAVYAIGVIAAAYASVRDPLYARTAYSLSGVVNGIGTFAFTLFVDPTAAGIVDSAVHGKRTIEDVRAMVFWLTVTMVLGTLISQLLLFPAAVVIDAAARLVHR